jgi:DEAD/DEAH box helicase domain-containing protein
MPKEMAELVVDLENKVILESHLQCAADEMPLSVEADSQYFGPLLRTVCDTRLTKDTEGWYHTHPNYRPRPAGHVSLRGGEEVKYTVVDVTHRDEPEGRVSILEEVEISRAIFEVCRTDFIIDRLIIPCFRRTKGASYVHPFVCMKICLTSCSLCIKDRPF